MSRLLFPVGLAVSLVVGALLAFGPGSASAQEGVDRAASGAASGAADEPGEADFVALVGGRVLPASSAPIERGTVLIRGGRIEAVGADVAVPPSARVIDCAGRVITPGLVDADATLGLDSASLRDGRTSADQRVADAVSPWGERIRTARENGVTTLFVTGGREGTFGGVAAALSTAPAPGEILDPDGALVISLSTDDWASGLSGAGRLASARAQFVAARDHRRTLERWRRDLAEYEAKRAAEEPTKEERLLLPQSVLDDMRTWSPAQRVAWREAAYKAMGTKYDKPKTAAKPPAKPRPNPALDVVASTLGHAESVEDESSEPALPSRSVLFRAELGSDVRGALAAVRKFKLSSVLAGGAGLLDPAVRAARLPVIVTHLADDALRTSGPLTRRPDDLVAQLVAAGLEPGLGSSGTGGRFLRLIAAREIGAGLSADDALKAATLWGAIAAGVGEVTGSLEVGKRADVVVWSGDPFAATSRAEVVVIGGRVVREASRD